MDKQDENSPAPDKVDLDERLTEIRQEADDRRLHERVTALHQLAETSRTEPQEAEKGHAQEHPVNEHGERLHDQESRDPAGETVAMYGLELDVMDQVLAGLMQLPYHQAAPLVRALRRAHLINVRPPGRA